MIPEDYEPYPDDGYHSLGDYPNIKNFQDATVRSGQINW